MSYSFEIRASSKTDAKLAVAAEFAKVVAGQPSHAKETPGVEAACVAFIDALQDDPETDVVIRVNGSLGGQWADNEIRDVWSVTAAITGMLADRPAPD